MNDLIRAKLKEIARYYEKHDLNYKLKHGKSYNFNKYSVPIVF